MGRLKKHQTKEEKAEMHRLASKKYYWKNKEQEDEKAKESYKRKKKSL